MKRTAPLQRRTPLKPKSQRKTRFEEELDAITPALEARSGGRCELGAPCCTGRAVDRCHRKGRGQGGTNNLANLLHGCRACHNWCHMHPALAYSLGWLVNSWQNPAEVEVLAYWNGLPPL